MPNTIRYLMLGGFLGAGKTTTIARLAQHYTSRGLKIGIVTNDQASDLFDTNTLRAQGFDVGEVAGCRRRTGPTSSSPSRSVAALISWRR